MIPMLFTEHSTDWTVNSDGFVGNLPDAISCTTTEERNGEFELTMRYPIDGQNFSNIGNRSIILAIPSPYRAAEPFRVYKIEYKSLDGTAYIYGEHISYDLKGFLMQFAAMSVGEYTLSNAITGVQTGVDNVIKAIPHVPFKISTDIEDSSAVINYTQERFFGTIRQMLSGSDDSITDALGYGEWEFTGQNCVLHKSRGSDIGLKVAYGHNITSLKASFDGSEYYGGVNGYYEGSYDVETDDGTEQRKIFIQWYEPHNYTERKYEKWLIYNCSNDFEIESSDDAWTKLKARVAQLKDEYCKDPEWSITVKFIDLNKMLGNFGVPAKPDLCDIVNVWYEPLGLNGVDAEIISIETDVLKEVYNEITIGKLKGSIAKTVAVEASV